MKNTKKLLLGLGSLTSVIAPMAAVVACGSHSSGPTIQKGVFTVNTKAEARAALTYLGKHTGEKVSVTLLNHSTGKVETITSEELVVTEHTTKSLTLTATADGSMTSTTPIVAVKELFGKTKADSPILIARDYGQPALEYEYLDAVTGVDADIAAPTAASIAALKALVSGDGDITAASADFAAIDASITSKATYDAFIGKIAIQAEAKRLHGMIDNALGNATPSSIPWAPNVVEVKEGWHLGNQLVQPPHIRTSNYIQTFTSNDWFPVTDANREEIEIKAFTGLGKYAFLPEGFDPVTGKIPSWFQTHYSGHGSDTAWVTAHRQEIKDNLADGFYDVIMDRVIAAHGGREHIDGQVIASYLDYNASTGIVSLKDGTLKLDASNVGRTVHLAIKAGDKYELEYETPTIVKTKKIDNRNVERALTDFINWKDPATTLGWSEATAYDLSDATSLAKLDRAVQAKELDLFNRRYIYLKYHGSLGFGYSHGDSNPKNQLSAFVKINGISNDEPFAWPETTAERQAKQTNAGFTEDVEPTAFWQYKRHEDEATETTIKIDLVGFNKYSVLRDLLTAVASPADVHVFNAEETMSLAKYTKDQAGATHVQDLVDTLVAGSVVSGTYSVGSDADIAKLTAAGFKVWETEGKDRSSSFTHYTKAYYVTGHGITKDDHAFIYGAHKYLNTSYTDKEVTSLTKWTYGWKKDPIIMSVLPSTKESETALAGSGLVKAAPALPLTFKIATAADLQVLTDAGYKIYLVKDDQDAVHYYIQAAGKLEPGSGDSHGADTMAAFKASHEKVEITSTNLPAAGIEFKITKSYAYEKITSQ